MKLVSRKFLYKVSITKRKNPFKNFEYQKPDHNLIFKNR